MNRQIVGRCPMCLGQVELAQPHVQVRNNFRVVNVYHTNPECSARIHVLLDEQVIWHYPAKAVA